MRRMIAAMLLWVALAVLILAQGASKVVACPNCKEAVSASTSEVANMSNGYNWSVLFMLTVPFSLLGTGAFMIRRASQRGMLPQL
jgi:hypothetical protein